MRKAFQTMVVFVLLFCFITGCASNSPVSTTTPAVQTEAATQQATTEPTPDTANNTPVDIEIMTAPWVGTPVGDNDPYKAWLDEHFNANFTLTQSSDFDTQILTRFASNDPPDIFDLSHTMLTKLYDQGVLVSDWSVYFDKMPTAAKNVTDIERTYYSENGKLMALPVRAGESRWAFEIRSDWLKNLNLSQPQTVDDLLNIARAFTFNDPDQNGKNDTYAFTSTGSNSCIGEIANLKTMFGSTDFYVADDGTVQNNITDGNELLFLKFFKQVVDEKLIDPDWYSESWDARKPNLYKGVYGIVWYPPMDLLTETNTGRQSDNAVLNWYEVMNLPKGTENGGKLVALNPYGNLRTSPASDESDTAKWNVILKFYEDTAWPNEGYFTLRWGVGIDGITLLNLDGGKYFVNTLGTTGVTKVGSGDGQLMGLYDYGKVVACYDDVITGTTAEPSDITYKALDLIASIDKMSRYSADHYLLKLNSDVSTEVGRILNEFEINYVLGKTTDYEAFKASWLAGGGQALIDQATEQYKAAGVIK